MDPGGQRTHQGGRHPYLFRRALQDIQDLPDECPLSAADGPEITDHAHQEDRINLDERHPRPLGRSEGPCAVARASLRLELVRGDPLL